MSTMISLMFWSKYWMLHCIIWGLFFPLLYSEQTEQTCPQNAGITKDKFVFCKKKFIGKTNANLASWHTLLQQIFADKLFINSFITVISSWKTIKDAIVLQYQCTPHSWNSPWCRNGEVATFLLFYSSVTFTVCGVIKFPLLRFNSSVFWVNHAKFPSKSLYYWNIVAFVYFWFFFFFF